MKGHQKVIEHLRKSLPATFGRSAINDLFPGIITSKTQANIDSSGDGPPSFKINRTVCYERDSYLEWLSLKRT